jgi:hypothetical protein
MIRLLTLQVLGQILATFGPLRCLGGHPTLHMYSSAFRSTVYLPIGRPAPGGRPPFTACPWPQVPGATASRCWVRGAERRRTGASRVPGPRGSGAGSRAPIRHSASPFKAAMARGRHGGRALVRAEARWAGSDSDRLRQGGARPATGAPRTAQSAALPGHRSPAVTPLRVFSRTLVRAAEDCGSVLFSALTALPARHENFSVPDRLSSRGGGSFQYAHLCHETDPDFALKPRQP